MNYRTIQNLMLFLGVFVLGNPHLAIGSSVQADPIKLEKISCGFAHVFKK